MKTASKQKQLTESAFFCPEDRDAFLKIQGILGDYGISEEQAIVRQAITNNLMLVLHITGGELDFRADLLAGESNKGFSPFGKGYYWPISSDRAGHFTGKSGDFLREIFTVMQEVNSGPGGKHHFKWLPLVHLGNMGKGFPYVPVVR